MFASATTIGTCRLSDSDLLNLSDIQQMCWLLFSTLSSNPCFYTSKVCHVFRKCRTTFSHFLPWFIINFEQENAKYARIASNFGSTPEFAYSSLPTSLFYFEYRPVRSVAIGSAKANSPEHKTYRSMPKKERSWHQVRWQPSKPKGCGQLNPYPWEAALTSP